MSSPTGSMRTVPDTTACLDKAYLQAHHVVSVPLVILFGEDSTLDISCKDSLQWLRTSPVLPRTAAPPPGEFVRAYRRQLEQAQTILSILPSFDVSGTVRSAISACGVSLPSGGGRTVPRRAPPFGCAA
jgi:fatty acid-binding protein DegV